MSNGLSSVAAALDTTENGCGSPMKRQRRDRDVSVSSKGSVLSASLSPRRKTRLNSMKSEETQAVMSTVATDGTYMVCSSYDAIT